MLNVSGPFFVSRMRKESFMNDRPPLLSTRLDLAIRTAAWAHRHQQRKGTELPYIVHPYAVMSIASKVTDDEDVLIACLFHDIIEDVPEQYSKDAMRDEFGERVVRIVEGVTKDDSLRDWRERSEAYLEHLGAAGIESVIVSAADKIHNLQSTLFDYELYREELWQRFNAGKESQLWWYQSVAQLVKRRLPDSPLTHELQVLTEKLRSIITG